MVPRRTRHGYTLVELMVVVTIVGLSAAAAAPSFSSALAHSRSGQAARELVRIGIRARSETAAYLRAHLVWLQPALGGGSVALLRGNTNSCLTENWNNAFTSGICGTFGSQCLEAVNLTDSEYRGVYTTELLFEPTGGGAVVPTATAICYTPSGIVWHAQAPSLAGIALSNANANPNARGGYRFVVRMLNDDGNVQGLVRRMMFPLGAPARSL